MAEKREIHEITVQALRELICSGGLDLNFKDEKSLNVSDLVGKYVIVKCFAFFADNFKYRSPFEKPYLYGVRDELTEGFWWYYDRREKRMGTHHCGVEYEVWHVVDDEQEPDKHGLYQRYALEAYLGDFAEEYDIDAIEDAVTVLDYSTGNRYWTMDDEELAAYIAGLDDEPRARRVDEGCSIFVRVTVPDLSDYMPGTHPVYDYFIRWDRRFVASKGASFFWAFETLTAWDVDTIVGLRTRTSSVVEVLDRETYLIVTGQSDAVR